MGSFWSWFGTWTTLRYNWWQRESDCKKYGGDGSKQNWENFLIQVGCADYKLFSSDKDIWKNFQEKREVEGWFICKKFKQEDAAKTRAIDALNNYVTNKPD